MLSRGQERRGTGRAAEVHGRRQRGGAGGKSPHRMRLRARAKRLREEPPDANVEPSSVLPNQGRGQYVQSYVTSACGIQCRVGSVTCMM